MFYTTEALQPIKYAFLLLVRLEQTPFSLQLDVILYTTEALQLQLDVILYTTEALQPIKINSCFWLDLN